VDARISYISAAFGWRDYITYNDARSLKFLEKLAFDRLLKSVHVGLAWMEAADGCMLIHRTFPVSDAINDDVPVPWQPSSVGAGKFSVGTFIVDHSFTGQDTALKHDLSVRRNRQIVGLAFDYLCWRTEKAAKPVPCIDAGAWTAHHRSNFVERWASDTYSDGHVLAQFVVSLARDRTGMKPCPHVDVRHVL
jgi:hypothetical protein